MVCSRVSGNCDVSHWFGARAFVVPLKNVLAELSITSESRPPKIIWGINTAAIPAQTNPCFTSMETYTLLSLGAFIGLTLQFTFCAVSALVTRRHRGVVNGSVAEKAPATEKDSNEYRPRVFIPNTLARWPWTRCVNPHHAVATKESEAWVMSLGAFSPKAQHAFNRAKFSKASPPTLTHALTLLGRSHGLYGLPNSEERQVVRRPLIDGF